MAITYVDPNESRDRRLAMLLQTASELQKNKIAREELDLKKAEQDPKVQAGKLASLFAMTGNTEQAERLMAFAQNGAKPTLPSQAPTAPPDYLMGPMQPNISLAGMGGRVGDVGLKSFRSKMGGSTVTLGQPTMNEYEKANLDVNKTLTTEKLKSQQETAAGAEKTLTGTDRYLKQFERSYDELVKYDPEIGKAGLSGWFSRKGAELANATDSLPETAALRAMAQPLAQQIATDIEGRATDEDRKIQSNAFADVLKKPSETNIRVASNSLLMLKDKGADISKVIKKLSKSKVDVMQKIVEQVYEEAPELRPKDVGVDELFKGL